MKKYFIAGTDTEVGKTYVTCLICNYLKKKGFKVGTLKPIESGVENNPTPDFKKIALASGDIEKPIYILKKPLAPYISAKLDNIEISIERIIKFYENDIKNTYDYYFIEGAGGLFVPITKNYLYIDLIKMFNCEVILVARTNLGTVNHTLLSIEALEKRKIPIKGIILNEIFETDEFMLKNNIEMIEHFSKHKVLTVIRKNQDKLTNNLKNGII